VRQGERRRPPSEREIGAERELIRVLLHRPGYFEQVTERIGEEGFRDRDLRRIFAAMLAHGADASPDLLAESLDGDAVLVMQTLLEEAGGLDHADETVVGSLSAMHERSLAERMEEIEGLMPLAASDQKDALTVEKSRLAAELRSLGSRRWKQFR
jgi:replicative DNA helicase